MGVALPNRVAPEFAVAPAPDEEGAALAPELLELLFWPKIAKGGLPAGVVDRLLCVCR